MIEKSTGNENRGRYLEAIILYAALYLSPSLTALTGINQIENGVTIEFPITASIIRIILYIIPSIALILYLMQTPRKIDFKALKPEKKDLICGIITLPSLLLIGIIISILSAYTSESFMEITYIIPSTITGWLILIIFCFFSAYFEEVFFRFYLISKKDELNMSTPAVLVFSTTLFAICHIYEGFWGVLNASAAGLVLGIIFIRYKSLHGISIAHALYNITAYIIYAYTVSHN